MPIMLMLCVQHHHEPTFANFEIIFGQRIKLLRKSYYSLGYQYLS